MAQVTSKMTLKLLIDKKENKVVFAEAGKEAVDFICSILTLPVGTVTRLLSEKEGMVGCLSNLYKSIEQLNDNYVQPDKHKNTVLKPNVCHATEESPLFKLTNEPNKLEIPQLYKCNSTGTCSVTNEYGKYCANCRYSMSTSVRFVGGNTAPIAVSSKGGFLKGGFTYIVMDDLVISPTSAFTGISILNDMNVDIKSIEEKVVDLDMAKGLKILKTSFQSKKVLTDVFLPGPDNKEAKRTGVVHYKPLFY